MRLVPQPDSLPSDSVIVIKALVRSADRIEMSNKLLARVIGVSEASVSRMRKGD